MKSKSFAILVLYFYTGHVLFFRCSVKDMHVAVVFLCKTNALLFAILYCIASLNSSSL